MKQVKRYRCINAYKMDILFSIGGIAKTLNFGGGNRYLSEKASYTTSDEEEQKFLERHPFYNIEFVLESKRNFEEPKVENVGPRIESFYTVKECQAFITKELKGKGYLYTSQSRCIDFLKQHNIEAIFKSAVI